MMVSGIQIDYKLKNGCSSRFNQKMFGRISTRKTKQGGLYSYYVPGVLHEYPHCRVFEGRIFVGTTTDVDFDPIMPFCEQFKLTTTSKDDGEVFLKTGKEKWQFHAKERGIKIDWR